MNLEKLFDMCFWEDPDFDADEVIACIQAAIAERDVLKDAVQQTSNHIEFIDSKLIRSERENEELKATVAQCVEALRDLHDWQNGPPLATYAVPWRAAMDMAEELLELYEVV